MWFSESASRHRDHHNPMRLAAQAFSQTKSLKLEKVKTCQKEWGKHSASKTTHNSPVTVIQWVTVSLAGKAQSPTPSLLTSHTGQSRGRWQSMGSDALASLLWKHCFLGRPGPGTIDLSNGRLEPSGRRWLEFLELFLFSYPASVLLLKDNLRKNNY